MELYLRKWGNNWHSIFQDMLSTMNHLLGNVQTRFAQRTSISAKTRSGPLGNGFYWLILTQLPRNGWYGSIFPNLWDCIEICLSSKGHCYERVNNSYWLTGTGSQTGCIPDILREILFFFCQSFRFIELLWDILCKNVELCIFILL